MMIDPRLSRIVATQPYRLLFATISGVHLYGFPRLAILGLAVVAFVGCSSQSPSREADREGSGAAVTATEAVLNNSEFTLFEPSSSRPVTAVMEIIPAEIRKAGSAEVQVRLAIAGAYYIYVSNAVGKPFTPVSLTVMLPDGIEFSGGWLASAPERTKTGELVYTDSVTFRRPLRTGSNAPVGRLFIRGEVHYQACTEELCWPPQTITLSSPLNVRSQ